RGKPENAATTPGRESEVATVPRNFGRTGGREGPLLSSSERNRERPPDCPAREGSTPDPSSQAQSARETRQCPQTATDESGLIFISWILSERLSPWPIYTLQREELKVVVFVEPSTFESLEW